MALKLNVLLSVPQVIFESAMLTAILAPLPEKTTLENAFSKVSSKILTPLISNKIFNTAC